MEEVDGIYININSRMKFPTESVSPYDHNVYIFECNNRDWKEAYRLNETKSVHQYNPNDIPIRRSINNKTTHGSLSRVMVLFLHIL